MCKGYTNFLFRRAKDSKAALKFKENQWFLLIFILSKLFLDALN